MNILFFTESGIGISALATDQICNLKIQNDQTFGVISSLEQENGLIDRVREAQIPILNLQKLEYHATPRQHIKQLREYVVANDIDIIHVQTNWELALCYAVKLSLLGRRRVKLVYTVHGFRHNSRHKRWLALLLLNPILCLMADRVICSCKYTRDVFPLARYKTSLLPLGIDDGYFSDEWEYARDAHLSLIFPAQFREGKRQDMIVRAFAKYVAKSGDSDSVVILPGEGPLRDQVKQLVSSLGIGDRVIMPGHCSKVEVKELYRRVNIAVVSSNREAFGQSIVEPYVMGKVVLSTSVGIAPELLDGHEGGFIFRTEDELCEVLCHLADHPEEIERIGKGNFENRIRFSWQQITSQYLDILRDLL